MPESKRRKRKPHSLKKNIFLTMILAVFIPMIAFIAVLGGSGVFKQIRDLPVSTMKNQLERTNFDLSSLMNTELKRTEYVSSIVNSKLTSEEERLSVMVDALNQDYLESILFYMTVEDNSWFCLEDTAPDNYTASNSDIVVLSGTFAGNRGVALSKNWTKDNQNEDLEAIKETVRKENISKNFWMVYRDSLYYICPVYKSGSLYSLTGSCVRRGELDQIIPEDASYTFAIAAQDEPVYVFHNRDFSVNDKQYTRYSEMLKIYGTFYGESEWSITVLCETAALTHWEKWMRNTIAVAFGIALFLFLSCALFILKRITDPLLELSQSIAAGEGIVELKRSNLIEVNAIRDAINAMYMRITKNKQRFNMAVQAVSDRMGTYEISENRGDVRISSGIQSMLSISDEEISNEAVSTECWERHMSQREKFGQYWLYTDGKGIKKYLEFHENKEESGTFGLILDRTEDMLRIHHLQYMSTHDNLTALYNMKYFRSEAQKLIYSHIKRVNALVFCDLDNLKYVNDTYGHSAGDSYIVRMAEAIRKLESSSRCIGARVSGDEFAFLLFGFDSREEILTLVNSIFDEKEKLSFLLPSGASYALKASAGIAWAPEDSKDINELVRYADFAMYIVKHSTKGAVGQFDKDIYEKKFYLLQKQEEFNRILDNNLIDYHYQPIVDVKNKKIYGYEALMRPRSKEFLSPLPFLEMARMQSKLYLIERLTFKNNLITYMRHKNDLFKDKYLFVNSIPNQNIDKQVFDDMDEIPKEDFAHMVVELTEKEQVNNEIGQEKLCLLKEWNIRIAIDDYGSGYNNEVTVMNTDPQYIKVDMELITNIHQNADKKELVGNIISMARKRGILVCAEGVEKEEELECVMELGVDLVQGYYFSKPLADVANITDADIRQKFTWKADAALREKSQKSTSN